MKSYNIQNYIRWKNEIQLLIHKLPEVKDGDFTIWNRKQMITGFLPLVESLARKFSTSQQASGVMDILDLLQEGNAGLTQAVDKLDYVSLSESEDQEKTLKSFLSKRIRGAIRRAIDINRGDIRIPEHKLNEIRKNSGQEEKMVQMFFNSIFASIDIESPENNMVYEIPDKTKEYNIDILNKYLLSIMEAHLSIKEYDVLRMSYGLDCDKMSANQIAEKLDIKGTAAFVRISQIKRDAINKLIETTDPSQVIDFL